jgi:hypothetical protein
MCTDHLHARAFPDLCRFPFQIGAPMTRIEFAIAVERCWFKSCRAVGALLRRLWP